MVITRGSFPIGTAVPSVPATGSIGVTVFGFTDALAPTLAKTVCVDESTTNLRAVRFIFLSSPGAGVGVGVGVGVAVGVGVGVGTGCAAETSAVSTMNSWFVSVRKASPLAPQRIIRPTFPVTPETVKSPRKTIVCISKAAMVTMLLKGVVNSLQRVNTRFREASGTIQPRLQLPERFGVWRFNEPNSAPASGSNIRARLIELPL